MFEREIRNLAFVPRWAIIRVQRQQSVAEHSYFVAIYADQIARAINWSGPRDQLMRLALFHDMDEILTGDISAPSKKVMESSAMSGWHIFEKWKTQRMEERINCFQSYLEIVSPWDKSGYAIIKTADLLEAVLFLCDETFSGNRNVHPVREYLADALMKSVDALPCNDKKDLDTLRVSISAAVGQAIGIPDQIVTGKEPIK